ncbi:MULTISPECIES: RICIN domain-containing protein [unclassified Micromonospora]|uniref:RICIN domain-containing protein n=1 Tax=unclassified Micromonospora TaxID=2617518 RepID=UPI0022B5E63B|nr:MULTISPECIES: RICIN domain-containing protein [unclassified Micromonospora]MCZ7420735.1 RICIN domain-containing protein [Verrucosispora sp. WMMA2121]WBB88805.1 RICIN domain-containing protein [Verrucosispora sp. WMMC514]
MSHTDGSGSVYGTRRAGPPRDPLLVTALGLGLVGVLVGVLFATGVLGGGEPAPVPTVAGPGPSTARPSPTESEPEPSPSRSEPSPEPSPSRDPDAIVGPRVLRGVGSGFCLGLDGDGEKAVAKLTGCSGGPEQQWVVNAFGPDTVTLTNAAHNQCLDVEGGSGDDGARLQQFGCHGEGNQQWRLQRVDGGAVVLAAVHSGKCAQARDGGAAAGTDIVQAPCDGNPAQRWTLQ